MTARLDITFYVLLVLTTIIRLLPSDLLIGIYTPTTLGWIWMLLLAPGTCIVFFFLALRDYKAENWKLLKWRTLLSITIAIALTFHWYFVIVE